MSEYHLNVLSDNTWTLVADRTNQSYLYATCVGPSIYLVSLPLTVFQSCKFYVRLLIKSLQLFNTCTQISNMQILITFQPLSSFFLYFLFLIGIILSTDLLILWDKPCYFTGDAAMWIMVGRLLIYDMDAQRQKSFMTIAVHTINLVHRYPLSNINEAFSFDRSDT